MFFIIMNQIIVRKVINCDIIEKQIITEFKSTFEPAKKFKLFCKLLYYKKFIFYNNEQMRKYGIEYFKGDKNKMIKIINTIIDREEVNTIINKEEITNSDNGIFAVGVFILSGIFLIGKTILQKTPEKKPNKK
jgi:hypothetical protein